MDDSGVVYLQEFLKLLPYDQLGQFEPVSCLMLVNISTDDFNQVVMRGRSDQWTVADLDVLRTINHEMYHFAQTVGSGYMYRRQHQLFTQISAGEMPKGHDFGRTAESIAQDAANSARKRRAAQILSLVSEMDWQSTLRGRAAPGDHSVAGAILPKLFASIRELDRAENEPNAEGVSITALIEGSAVVHAELLMAQDEDPRTRIEAQLATLPPPYRVLFDRTMARCGNRGLAVILPATALALRYSRPHDAYLPMLELIEDDPTHDPIARGRAISTALPEIAAAGAILGTAIDVHQPTSQYSVYQAMLRDLADGKWSVDSYELLADPRAMQRVPSFPLSMLMTDGSFGDVQGAGLGVRAILMSIVLRVRSRSPDELQFRKSAEAWLATWDWGTRPTD